MSTGYHLLDHQNPNAPVRADGRRYWGYPGRASTIRPVVVVHSAEAIPDRVGADLAAENVASYFTHSDRPASYHRISDADSRIALLPFAATAFHVAASGWNSRTIGVSTATQAAAWGQDPGHDRRLLANLAADVADALRFLATVTPHPARDLVRLADPTLGYGGRGITFHGVIQADRSDPWTSHPDHVALTTELLDLTLDLIDPQEDDPMTADQEARIMAKLEAIGSTVHHVSKQQDEIDNRLKSVERIVARIDKTD